MIEATKKRAENVSTGTWRVVVGLLLTGALSLFGWNLYETYSLGTAAVTRPEFQQHETDNREDFKETQELLREQQKTLESKIDKIRDLLINKLGGE